MSSPHYKFVVLLFSRQINRPIFENVAEEDLLRERSECTERPWAPSADSPTPTLLRSWPLTSPKSNCRPTTLASTSLLNSFTSFLPHPPNNSFRRSLFFYVCFICFPGNSRKERRKLGILRIYFDSSLLKHENFNNYLSSCFLKIEVVLGILSFWCLWGTAISHLWVICCLMVGLGFDFVKFVKMPGVPLMWVRIWNPTVHIFCDILWETKIGCTAAIVDSNSVSLLLCQRLGGICPYSDAMLLTGLTT